MLQSLFSKKPKELPKNTLKPSNVEKTDQENLMWKEIEPLAHSPQPAPRQAFGYGFDPKAERLIVFSGGPMDGPYDQEVWSYSVSSNKWLWHNMSSENSKNVSAANKLNTNNHLNIGQLSSDDSNHLPDPINQNVGTEINKLDLNLNSRESVNPIARGACSACEMDGKLWVFGGWSVVEHLNDLWVFDLQVERWSCVEASDPPAPRRGATLTPFANKLYLFGGSSGRGSEPFDDLYEFDPLRKRWSKLANSGTPRYRHTTVAIENKLVIFGGISNNESFVFETLVLLVWDFELGKFQNWPTQGDQIIPREGHSAHVSQKKKKMVIVGGTGPLGAMSEVWIYQWESNFSQNGKWSKVELNNKPQPKFCFHGSFLDSQDQRLVVFGGRKGVSVSNSLFSLVLP